MEIQEYKDRKTKLENDIASAINSLVIHFRIETNFSPYYISVDMIETTTIGEKNKAYIACNVKTDVEL